MCVLRGRLRQILCCVALFGLMAGASTSAQTGSVDTVVAAYYPPLMIDTSPTSPGLAIEIIREAARRSGRQITLEFIPFHRALHVLENSDAIMPALFRNSAREDRYNWLAQIDATHVEFQTLGAPINSLDEARTLTTIGVEESSSPDVFLSDRGFENLLRLPGPDSSARMLRAGRIDAWLIPANLAQEAWDRLGFTEALTVGAVVHEYPIYIATGKALAPDISEAYRDAVQAMKADGTLAAILLKYR